MAKVEQVYEGDVLLATTSPSEAKLVKVSLDGHRAWRASREGAGHPDRAQISQRRGGSRGAGRALEAEREGLHRPPARGDEGGMVRVPPEPGRAAWRRTVEPLIAFHEARAALLEAETS